MSEEQEENKIPQLDVNDIVTLRNAVRLANRKGAYEMEESASIWPAVDRIEKWLKYFESAQNEMRQRKEGTEASSTVEATEVSEEN